MVATYAASGAARVVFAVSTVAIVAIAAVIVVGDIGRSRLECPTLTPGRRGSQRTREKGAGAAEDNR